MIPDLTSGAEAKPRQPLKFRRIATEEAFATHELLDALHGLTLGMAYDPDVEFLRLLLEDTPLGNRVRPQLTDFEYRLREMDEYGVDMHVLSITSPGVQMFEPSRAVDLSKLLNEQVSLVVKAHPKRFAALAAVAPQDPVRAACEIERAKNVLGLCGVIINSHTNGEYLDQEKYWPILEAAEALEMPIYIHPRAPTAECAKPYRSYGLEGAIWGYQVEAGGHAARILAGGVLDRYTKLKIILGHGGEGIPFWLPRMHYMYEASRAGRHRGSLTIPEYFERNFIVTTSGMNDAKVLQFLMEVCSPSRVMWAIDYPYQKTPEAVEFMDRANISRVFKQMIYAGNAERVFKLTVPK